MAQQVLIGKVVKVISPERVVMNLGTEDGVTPEMKFLVYTPGEEIIDPETRKSLGVLEHAKGRGRPVHIQEKMSVIETYEFEIFKREGGDAESEEEEAQYEKVKRTFDNVEIGDQVKLLG
jgi:hypothetical protein